MCELVRVLKPDGYLIVCVPFLQPFHPSPEDFRRLTKDGLKQLGENHGLRVVSILPVHSITQTIGWISWQYLTQKRSLWKYTFWPFIWAWTRISYRTDREVFDAANAFQAVFRK